MDKDIEKYIEESEKYLKLKIQKSAERREEVDSLTSMLNTLVNRYEKSKHKENSGDIFNDIMEIRSELKFLSDYNKFSNKVINDSMPLFDIKVCDLLQKIGDKLDEKYGETDGYERVNYTKFEHFENEEYDDLGEYTTYNHTMDAGYKIYSNNNLQKEVMLPAISFGTIGCRLSDNYIYEHENVNLLSSGLIGAKDVEFKGEDWQSFFWDIYKENLRYELNRKLANGERVIEDQYQSELDIIGKTERGE